MAYSKQKAISAGQEWEPYMQIFVDKEGSTLRHTETKDSAGLGNENGLLTGYQDGEKFADVS